MIWLPGALFLLGHSALMAEDAEAAEAVFLRLQAKYESLESLRADFTQTMSSPYSEQDESFSGTMILQGEKYRIETETELLFVNGIETYVYRPNERQVLINDVVEGEESFSPSAFLLNYDDRFTVLDAETVLLNGEKHHRLNLKPKGDDSFFREATLWMRDRDDLITRLSMLDVNETRMMFELTNIEVNPALEDDVFTFTPPDGVEVIDLRS